MCVLCGCLMLVLTEFQIHAASPRGGGAAPLSSLGVCGTVCAQVQIEALACRQDLPCF